MAQPRRVTQQMSSTGVSAESDVENVKETVYRAFESINQACMMLPSSEELALFLSKVTMAQLSFADVIGKIETISDVTGSDVTGSK